MTRLAVLLQATRKKQNISQVELAERIGVHFNTLSRAENGGMPNRNNLKRMAEFLGEPVDSLLTDVGSESVGEMISQGHSGPMMTAGAARILEHIALEAGMTRGQWLSRMLEWIDQQPAVWREFLIETVKATRTGDEGDEALKLLTSHVHQTIERPAGAGFPSAGRLRES